MGDEKEKPGEHCRWKEEYMNFKKAVIERHEMIEQYEASSRKECEPLEHQITDFEATAEWLQENLIQRQQKLEGASSEKQCLTAERSARLQAVLEEMQQQRWQVEADVENIKATIKQVELLLAEGQEQAAAQRCSEEEVQPPEHVLKLERKAQASYDRRKAFWLIQDRAKAWLQAASKLQEDQGGPWLRSRKRRSISRYSPGKPLQRAFERLPRGSATAQQSGRLASHGDIGSDERSMLLNMIAEMKVPPPLSPLPPSPPRDGEESKVGRFEVALPDLPSESPWLTWLASPPEPGPVPESTASSEPSQPARLLEVCLKASQEQQLQPATMEEPAVPWASSKLPQDTARVLEHIKEPMVLVSISAPEQGFVPEVTVLSEPSQPTRLSEAGMQESLQEQLELAASSKQQQQDHEMKGLKELVVTLASSESPQKTAMTLEHVEEPVALEPVSAPELWSELTPPSETPQPAQLSGASMQESLEHLELATSSKLEQQDIEIDFKGLVVTSASSEPLQETAVVQEDAEKPVVSVPISVLEPGPRLTPLSEPPQPTRLSESSVQESLEEQLELATSTKLEQHSVEIEGFKDLAVTLASSELPQETAMVLEHAEEPMAPVPISAPEPGQELTSPSDAPQPTQLSEASMQESREKQQDLEMEGPNELLVTSASSELPQETAVVLEYVEESVVPAPISALEPMAVLESTPLSGPPEPAWLPDTSMQASLEQLESYATSSKLEQKSLVTEVLEELVATSVSSELPQETMVLAPISAPEPGSVPKVTSLLEQSESTVQLPQETAMVLEHTEEPTVPTAISALKPGPVPEVTALPEPSQPTRLLEPSMHTSLAKRLESTTSSKLEQQGLVMEALEEHVVPLVSAEVPQETSTMLKHVEEPVVPEVVSALVPEPVPDMPSLSEPPESTLLLNINVQTSLEEQLESATSSKLDGLVMETLEESGGISASPELSREPARVSGHVEEPLAPVAISLPETALAVSTLSGPPQTAWPSGLLVLGHVAECAARYELKQQNVAVKEPVVPLPVFPERTWVHLQESVGPAASLSKPTQQTATALLPRSESVLALHPEAAVMKPQLQLAAAVSPAEKHSQAGLPVICPVTVCSSTGTPSKAPTVSIVRRQLREGTQPDEAASFPSREQQQSEEPPLEGEHRAAMGGEPSAQLQESAVLQALLAVASKLSLVLDKGFTQFGNQVQLIREDIGMLRGAMQLLTSHLQHLPERLSCAQWQSPGVVSLLVKQQEGPSQEQGGPAVCLQQSIGSSLRNPGPTGIRLHEVSSAFCSPGGESPTWYPCAQEHNGQASEVVVPMKRPYPVHQMSEGAPSSRLEEEEEGGRKRSRPEAVCLVYSPHSSPRSVPENQSTGSLPTVPISSRLSENGYSPRLEERQESSEAATPYADFLESCAHTRLSEIASSEIMPSKEVKVFLGRLKLLAMQSRGRSDSLVAIVLSADRDMFVCAVLTLLDRCKTNPMVVFCQGKCEPPLFTKIEELLLTALAHGPPDGQAALLSALRARFHSSWKPKKFLAQGAYVRLTFALCRSLGEVALARSMVWELMHSDLAPFLVASAVGAWPNLLGVWPQGVVQDALSYLLYRCPPNELSDTLLSYCYTVLQQLGPLPRFNGNLQPLAEDLLRPLLTPHQCLDTCPEHRMALEELCRRSPKTALPWVLKKQLVPQLRSLLSQLQLPLVQPHAVCLVKLLGALWKRCNKMTKIFDPLLEQMASCLAGSGSSLRDAVIEAFRKLPGFEDSHWAVELAYWFRHWKVV